MYFFNYFNFGIKSEISLDFLKTFYSVIIHIHFSTIVCKYDLFLTTILLESYFKTKRILKSIQQMILSVFNKKHLLINYWVTDWSVQL